MLFSSQIKLFSVETQDKHCNWSASLLYFCYKKDELWTKGYFSSCGYYANDKCTYKYYLTLNLMYILNTYIQLVFCSSMKNKNWYINIKLWSSKLKYYFYPMYSLNLIQTPILISNLRQKSVSYSWLNISKLNRKKVFENVSKIYSTFYLHDLI